MARLLKLVALILLAVGLNAGAHAQGTWSAVQSIPVAGMTNGKMFYQYLLLNYTGSGTRSPMLVYEHENSEGDKCYPNNPSACATLTAPLASGGSGVQNWYNNSSFQARYCANGCVVVSVAADQTSDPSGATSNFGGYADTPGSEPNERGVIAVIQALIAQLYVDTNRIYVTGDSLGGIGSQAIALDYGIKTGTQGQIITATMPFSGAIYRGGQTAPTNGQLAQIQGGGLQLNVNGVGDTGTSSNPALWSEPTWRAITGNSSYPGPPAGGAAGSSPFHFLLDTNLGHDVWDTYRPMPTGTPLLDLLFAANSGGGGGGGGGGGSPGAALPPGYLRTAGAQIQDGTGTNVRLACTGYAPTGTIAADLAAIKAQGFNCARVDWFDALTCPGGTCSFSTFDQVAAAALTQNLKVVFQHRGNEGVSGTGSCTIRQQNGLWYDLNGSAPWTITNNTDGCGTAGTVTYDRFKANWLQFAAHYKGNTTVIGFALAYEPTTFGNPACCGTGGGGGSGQFQIQNGQVIDPNGNVFVAHGVNVDWDAGNIAIANSAAGPLTTLFPNINFVRVPVRPLTNVGTASATYPSPSQFASFISFATANHIVIELEDHSSNGGQWECFISGPEACQISSPPTGGALTTMLNFWVAVAQMYKNNPYVWIGSLNEINSADGTYSTSAISTITTYQDALYKAVRNAGWTNIIQMGNGIGGGNPGTVGSNSGQIASLIAQWHNITWYMHSYYNNGTPAGALALLQGSTAACCGGSGGSGYTSAQTLRSADGLVPVIFDECGAASGNQNSTDATSMVSALKTVQGLGVGSACWSWYTSDQWHMVNNGFQAGGPFSLTTWGQEMSDMIRGFPPNPTTPSGGGSTAASFQPGSTNWYENPGQDGHFWKLPFQNSAAWITSGPQFTTLRTGTPTVNVRGNFGVPFYVGTSGMPIVTVTDGTRTIQVHMPLGAEIEGPTSSTDQSVGGTDQTKPYLVWSISGAKMYDAGNNQITQVQASGTTIRGTYGMSVQDGSGAIMEDAVTGTPGTNNSIGGIQDLELTKIRNDPTYIIPHMLAFQLDIGQAAPGTPGTLAWPLAQGDGGATYTGVIPQGITIGIPASTPRPLGKSRGWYALFDQLKTFGMFNYNFGAVGGVNFVMYSTDAANASLVSDIVSSWQDIGKNYIAILNYNTGVAGAQYSQATAKGATPGSTGVALAPPLLDLSPTGGINVAPSTFGAWYPNINYTVTPTHITSGGTGTTIGANWGSGNGGDLRAMVSDVGLAMQTADPGALIIVDGIMNNSTLFSGVTRGSGTYPITAGNVMDLTTVSTVPPACCVGELVFSIHDYPTSISAVAPDSGPNASTIRNTAWGYLVKNNAFPVWVGEAGASLDNTNGQISDETAWASSLTQYVNGQLGGQGGPTFTGCQQPIGSDWWSFGNQSGRQPDGTKNADGTNRSGQQAYWSTLLYTTCSGGGGGGGGGGATAWNPLDASAAIALTNSSVTATLNAATTSSVRSSTSQSTGRVCGEIAATSISPNWDVGLANSTFNLTGGGGLGAESNGIGFDPNSAGAFQGIFYNNTVLASGPAGSVTGEHATICADLGAKLIWVSNETMRSQGAPWNNSATANPATTTGGISFSGISGPYFLIFNANENGSSATLNATGPFAVATPAGFSPWQTVSTSGHPFILIFGANDNRPPFANDDMPVPFLNPVALQ